MELREAIQIELEKELGPGVEVTHEYVPRYGTKLLTVTHGKFEYAVLCGALHEPGIRGLYIEDIIRASKRAPV